MGMMCRELAGDFTKVNCTVVYIAILRSTTFSSMDWRTDLDHSSAWTQVGVLMVRQSKTHLQICTKYDTPQPCHDDKDFEEAYLL